jgi:carbon monoxide dehydrogenase subunit G
MTTTVSIDVEKPAEEVFAYATDPRRFCEWQDGVVSGSMEGKGALAVGDLCRSVRRIGGAERSSTSEVVRLDAPRAWSVQGIDGPVRARVDVDVAPVAEARSRISIAVDFEGHGIGRLLVPLLVRRQARAEMPRNIARLKACLEAVPR